MCATTATAPAIGLQIALISRAIQRQQALAEGVEAKEGAEPHLEDGEREQLLVKSSKTNTMRVALRLAMCHFEVTTRSRRDWEMKSLTKQKSITGHM